MRKNPAGQDRKGCPVHEPGSGFFRFVVRYWMLDCFMSFPDEWPSFSVALFPGYSGNLSETDPGNGGF